MAASSELKKIDASRVATGPGEVGDKTKPHGVFGSEEDDRNRRGRGLDRQCHKGATTRDDHDDSALGLTLLHWRHAVVPRRGACLRRL